jgi:ADP-heptose:LPS heptosyltransferase
MKFSKAYIGNDTGPLHLANLIQIPSLCIYLSTEPQTYGPIFADLNFPLINPKSLDESIDAADNFLRKIS